MTQRVSDENLAAWAERSEREEALMWKDSLVLDLRDARAEIARLREAVRRDLLNEVAISGVEYDAGRYLTVQIDRDTWNALQAAVWEE